MALEKSSENVPPATACGGGVLRLETDGLTASTSRWKVRIFSVALWVVMFGIFLRSPTLQMNDSRYSMLTAESLLRNGTPDLSRYTIPDFEADLPFDTVRGNHAYQLVRTNGRLLYGFAHGGSFLAVPFVALMNRFGVSPATPDLKFDARGEAGIQKILAAAVSAFAVMIFFLTAVLVLNLPWSAVIAVGAGLGSQVWSTASRGMWQHTWEIMLSALVAYLLLSATVRNARVRPVLLATLLSWIFFARPTGAVAVICVSAYVFACRRSEFVPMVTAGALWAGAFVVYSLWIFGTLLPFYYFTSFPRGLAIHLGTAFYGILLSPSRGVIIFTPISAWALFVALRFWRSLISKPLALTCFGAVAGIFLTNLSHAEWWGGACYGPRFMSDAVSWLVLLAILGIAAIPPQRRAIHSPMMAAGALLLIISIAINGYGAIAPETMAWNLKGPSPAIMLDWSRPQFLAGWTDRR